MNWNVIVNESSPRPPKEKVVVGYWISGPYVFAGLCYFDTESNEWFSAQPENYEDPVNEPDYWIDHPE